MDLKKHNKHITVYKKLQTDASLHPLVKAQIKARLLQNLHAETNSQAERYMKQERRSNFMRYIIATLMGILMLGAGTAFAADRALPGDHLYPVKLAVEQARLSLATSTEARADLEAQFAERRADELAKVSASASAKTDVDSSDDSGHVAGQASVSASANNEARSEAEEHVSRAITRLHSVQGELEAKGNATAAAAIGQTINRLEHQVEVEHDSHVQSQGQNNSGSSDASINGSSSSNGNVNSHSDGDDKGVNLNVDTNDSLDIHLGK